MTESDAFDKRTRGEEKLGAWLRSSIANPRSAATQKGLGTVYQAIEASVSRMPPTLSDAWAAAPQPQASEGAALAMSGGVVLVLGGYAATGATRAGWAWRMQPPAVPGEYSELSSLSEAELARLEAALLTERRRRA